MKGDVIALALMPGLLAVAATAQSTGYTEWSAPVNLGPPINSENVDACVSISKNGRSLYYAAQRPAPVGVGSWDLYVSKRASVNDPWGMPVLVPNVNSTFQESCPALSPDEHRLFFASTQPGGCGKGDYYVSYRHDRRDDFGWQAPVHLGCVVNSEEDDNCGTVFEDETGTEVLYFGSRRPPGGPPLTDLYASRMDADGTFGPPQPIAELNTQDYTDHCPAVRRDGLEVIFCSNRPGGLGGSDFWMATRASTEDPWSEPVNLTVLNSPATESGKMSFSFNGRQFYFYSNRPEGYGGYDVYVATREKLRQ
jgi:hypothetical protein